MRRIGAAAMALALLGSLSGLRRRRAAATRSPEEPTQRHRGQTQRGRAPATRSPRTTSGDDRRRRRPRATARSCAEFAGDARSPVSGGASAATDVDFDDVAEGFEAMADAGAPDEVARRPRDDRRRPTRSSPRPSSDVDLERSRHLRLDTRAPETLAEAIGDLQRTARSWRPPTTSRSSSTSGCEA